jgi:hypothetical protein
MNDVYENVTAADQIGLGERVVGGGGELADDDSGSHSSGRPLPGTRPRGWVLSQPVFQNYAIDGLFDALAWNLVTNGSFSMDGATAASHIGWRYPVLLALLHQVVGHQPAWFPISTWDWM